MGRLFGTDGIRGIANRDLSIRRAEEVGMALAEVIRGEHPKKRPTVVIGRDTRLSGEMLQITSFCRFKIPSKPGSWV